MSATYVFVHVSADKAPALVNTDCSVGLLCDHLLSLITLPAPLSGHRLQLDLLDMEDQLQLLWAAAGHTRASSVLTSRAHFWPALRKRGDPADVFSPLMAPVGVDRLVALEQKMARLELHALVELAASSGSVTLPVSSVVTVDVVKRRLARLPAELVTERMTVLLEILESKRKEPKVRASNRNVVGKSPTKSASVHRVSVQRVSASDMAPVAANTPVTAKQQRSRFPHANTNRSNAAEKSGPRHSTSPTKRVGPKQK